MTVGEFVFSFFFPPPALDEVSLVLQLSADRITSRHKWWPKRLFLFKWVQQRQTELSTTPAACCPVCWPLMNHFNHVGADNNNRRGNAQQKNRATQHCSGPANRQLKQTTTKKSVRDTRGSRPVERKLFFLCLSPFVAL